MNKLTEGQKIIDLSLEKDVEKLIEFINLTTKNFKEKGYSVKLISDGYHTFEELYTFRMLYNAALFNQWAKGDYEKSIWDSLTKGHVIMQPSPLYDVCKSWKHNDGEWCFGEEKKWFIVSAKLPTGLISNHYKAEYWDLFKVPEVEKAIYTYDGHTSKDVINRLTNLILDN